MTKKNDILKIKKVVVFLILIFVLSLGSLDLGVINNAQAATNLLKGGDFEGDVHLNWSTWSAGKNVDFFRSYDSPLGQGSYSAGIEALGGSGDKFAVGLVGNAKNVFSINGSKQYYLQFNAKASIPLNISLYLQNSTTFSPVTNVVDQAITANWTKYLVLLAPSGSETVNSVLAIALGDMPSGSVLNIDSLNLFENSITLSTTEVKGNIGETDKSIRFNTTLPFTESEIEIEVPYFYSDSGSAGVKRFNPEKISGNLAYFNLAEGTFGGVGTVYAQNVVIGNFTYNILAKITDFFPSFARADQDLTVEGSGFSPIDSTTFLVVKVINSTSKVSEYWIKPSFMDSKLKSITAKMPAGLISGDIYAVTNFKGLSNLDIQNKSNKLKCQVMPVIFWTEWSNRGYEHVGDKIKIFGLGIGQNPTVNFYDASKNLISSKKAKLISITNATTSIETIEVETPINPNKSNITVTVNGVESDFAGSLVYEAKPKIIKIISQKFRPIQNSKDTIAAAKIGEEITITGEGFYNPSAVTYVEFQRLNDRIRLAATSTAVTADGKQLKIVVPPGTQNGFIAVETSNGKSNFVPMEIIPTIIDYWPNPVVPGFPMTINSNGVGSNINLVKVYLQLSNDQEVALKADSIDVFDANTFIHVTAPLALSSNYNKIIVQYDRWRDDSTPVLNVLPHITDASINLDDKILVIKGYGFSIAPNENEVTYRLADVDMTPTSPQTKFLGVYPTEEGQELRILILESNYYYGNVSVKVGTFTSNQVNFGPVSIRKITRRVEFVRSLNQVMGVLYISGNNFGSTGGVLVGNTWADVHYRSNFFIIAVVPQANVNDNPVIIARE